MRSDTNATIVSRGCGYVLTIDGHLALMARPSCKCEPRWAGLLLVCSKCDTVYARYDQSYLTGHAR